MSGDVALGWVHPGLVRGDFMDSVLSAVEADGDGPRRIAAWRGQRCSANVSHGRNDLVRWFLNQPTARWLLMVDTDMVFTPDAVTRLLGVVDEREAPVVGGLCFAQSYESGAVWPTLYETEPLGDGGHAFLRRSAWPPDALMRVGGTGAAFLAVHRSVFETVRDRRFSPAYPWFQETENAIGRISEDLTFCLRAGLCGFPIHVDTGVRVGHVKEHVVGARAYLAQRLMPEIGGGDA